MTFTKDIAPIFFAHCSSCHRPGEVGPFSLLTYRDARQRLTQIGDVTRRGLMPPWKPEPGKNAFIGDRSLSPEDLQRIQDWVAQGGPEGNRRDLPPTPQWSSGWQLGVPDLVVRMNAPYALQADGGDVFRTFVLPAPDGPPRFVRAIEFQPGVARAVHHANIGVDRTRSSRRLDAADVEPGYEGGMVPDAAYPAGHLLGWTPGQRPRPSPEGTSWRLEPGSDFVIQAHMQPTGKPEAVQISIGVYFTTEAPVRTPVGLRLGRQTIDIAPGDRAYEVTDRYVLPADVDVLAVQPHAHNLAREMQAEATLPDGSIRPLISIKDWDFRWQDVYRYVQPIALPKGTTLSMRFTYDNSASNPRAPSQTSQRVVWGQKTSDEMGDLWVQVVPRSRADLGVLGADFGRKTLAEDLAAYTTILERDPLNPLRHDMVGMLNFRSGRLDAAAEAFRGSLQLNADSAPTRYNLGLVLSAQRKYAEGIVEFREALRIDPNYSEAHNNLGAMLHITGQFEDAAVHYRRAFEIRPESAEAHGNYGRLLTALGRNQPALDAFNRAIALSPNTPSFLTGLAWVLSSASEAGARNPVEAVRVALRAVDVTARRDPASLDALGAAYAAAGEFDRAQEAAQEAMRVADELGRQPLWVEIRERLRLYQRGVAFVLTCATC